MKVVTLAAGAGGMYCGSCMRDNRVAATLQASGHDVVLSPLYTPLRTDEQDVSEHEVLYGGINVFLQQASAVFRRRSPGLDRILDAPALLRGVGRFASSTRPQDLGPLTVSVLEGEDGAQRKELIKLTDALESMHPDLINLPNLMFVGVAGHLRRSLRCPIVCTLSGEDIFLDLLPQPFRDRAFALIEERSQEVDAFVAVTRYFADHACGHFKLRRDAVHYVPMGIQTKDFPQAHPSNEQPFTIGYLARICPEKGLRGLCDAFIGLRKSGRNCRLKVAGYVGAADQPYLDECLRRVHDAGYRGDVDYLGEVTRAEKIRMLQSLHVLSVPTVYAEAKGFYVLEAMACGVPVVQPNHGSFPELIERTGGGHLFPAGDTTALTDALIQLMDHDDLRSLLAQAAREGVQNHFTDEIMADQTWQLYERLVRSGAAS